MKKILFLMMFPILKYSLFVSAYANYTESLKEKVLLNPISIQSDPYIDHGRRIIIPLKPPVKGSVCAIHFQPDLIHYSLQTYASREEAIRSSGIITHESACGTCSSLQDLSVYLETRNLEKPARRCGVYLFLKKRAVACLEKIGFTHACALTWYYSIRQTAHFCFKKCILSWIKREPNNLSDGSLNSCLQCDEDYSGPIFKATVGRNRRNSGIQSTIERPAEQIADIIHEYLNDLSHLLHSSKF